LNNKNQIKATCGNNNDIIIDNKDQSKTDIYSFVDIIYRNKYNFNKKYTYVHRFILETVNKSFEIYVDTLKEKKQWFFLIQAAIQQLNINNKINFHNDSNSYIRNNRDKNKELSITMFSPMYTSGCELCNLSFGTLTRQYNCKHCNKTICDKC